MPYDHHIFISYSHLDRFVMRTIQSAFEKAGFTVWTDDRLEPGTTPWSDAIKGAIQGACCVVIILSEHAKESLWVAMEYAYADAFEKRVYPVVVSGKADEVKPDYLDDIQYSDLTTTDDDALPRLIEAIRKHLDTLPGCRQRLTEAAHDQAAAETPQTVDPAVYNRIIQLIGSYQLNSLVEAAARLPGTAGARAGVFFVDPGHDELYVGATAGDFSDAERQLRFKRQQGVVGDVWHNKKPLIVDLANLKAGELEVIFRLTPEQIGLTQRVKSILAVPIFAADDQMSVVGVLSIDSPLSPSEAKLDQTDILNDALEISSLIAKAL